MEILTNDCLLELLLPPKQENKTTENQKKIRRKRSMKESGGPLPKQPKPRTPAAFESQENSSFNFKRLNALKLFRSQLSSYIDETFKKIPTVLESKEKSQSRPLIPDCKPNEVTSTTATENLETTNTLKSNEGRVYYLTDERCPECKIVFRKSSLRDHLKRVHKYPDGRVKEFMKEVQSHWNTIYQSKRCAPCDRFFDTSRELRIHLSVMHSKKPIVRSSTVQIRGNIRSNLKGQLSNYVCLEAKQSSENVKMIENAPDGIIPTVPIDDIVQIMLHWPANVAT